MHEKEPNTQVFRRRLDDFLWRELREITTKQDKKIDEALSRLDALSADIHRFTKNEAINMILQYPGSTAEDLRTLRSNNEMQRSILRLLKFAILIGSFLGCLATGFSFYVWFHSTLVDSSDDVEIVIPQKFN